MVVIEKVNCVLHDGSVSVNLSGVRADLSQNVIIKPSDIKRWFGVDENGYSVEYRIQSGTRIYFDCIHPSTREIENPRFSE